ncbi:hypothetical protein PV703_15100 [Streptomyces sp. ME01-24h]|nr:hypothetical protein [Streptomyces sp. ME19-03-3]MDX3354612.1 hypothetical protein [Streptomyces sp. ME01-24h]
MSAPRPVPPDEQPVPPIAHPVHHVTTGGRTAYDRSTFHFLDHEGRALLVTGLGVQPGQGVADAYATLTRRTGTLAVRAGDTFGEDRARQHVGPLRVDVLEPLRRLRLTCDDTLLSYDLEWEAAFPAVEEPYHPRYRGARLLPRAGRFVQAGTCHGVVRTGNGEEIRVERGRWTAARERSRGAGPAPGEAPGRAEQGHRPGGFHWLWMAILFDDSFVLVTAQEDADGYHTPDEVLQITEYGPDRRLGPALVDVTYRKGTRDPVSAVVHLAAGRIEAEVMLSGPLAVLAGHPPARDRRHGRGKGRGWLERRAYDPTDPAVAAPIAYGVTDHAARFAWDGRVGYGILEHGGFSRHTPRGFTRQEAM